MNRHHDPNPFEEEEEVNPFSVTYTFYFTHFPFLFLVSKHSDPTLFLFQLSKFAPYILTYKIGTAYVIFHLISDLLLIRVTLASFWF